MPEPMTSIPLAFTLAVSASVSNAAPLSSPPQSEALAPGSLRSLLSGDAPAGGQLPKNIGRLSQWFNGGWFNCFSGNWRRC
jgi:hypothetical protein